MYKQALKPTTQKTKIKRIFGYDIETHNKNKDFTLATIYDLDNETPYTFYTKEETTQFFKQKRFQGAYIAATNLGFDFWGTFYNTEEEQNFLPLYRGSELILAKTYLTRDKAFTTKPKTANERKPIVFLDTMNYAKIALNKAAKIIGQKKLEKPGFLGQKPTTKKEWEELETYNQKDAEISAKFLKYILESFVVLGASPKPTIASAAMSLYKNKHLKGVFWQPKPQEMLEQFRGYYGGRCEAFFRGKIYDYEYYDINSLYPSVMKDKEYPDPNTQRQTQKNTMHYINFYEGISLVKVKVKKTMYPLLPYRTKTKLIFPTGTFTAWQTHAELKEAIKRDQATVLHVYKTYYFKKTCKPFESFVTEMYSLRQKLKEEKNPMEYVAKILMNSLYGKFGQKFVDREELLPFDHTKEELDKLKHFERIQNFIRIKKDYTRPASFCMPIFAIYTTSYARLKLYDYIQKTQPIYCDTDSVITETKIPNSDVLGEMKHEAHISEGIIVRPKMYGLKTEEKDVVKVKGVGKKLTMQMFLKICLGDVVEFEKFMKFKESIRRNFVPNEIQNMKKALSLEDEKRDWGKKMFSISHMQESLPLHLSEFSEKTRGSSTTIPIRAVQKSF